MPSPPLVPDEGPIDLAHLNQMTFGDAGLEREVLAMFAAQSADILVNLKRQPSEARELAHKLKGSARAVGAHDVADAAEALETALLRGEASADHIARLDAAVARARAAIAEILRRS